MRPKATRFSTHRRSRGWPSLAALLIAAVVATRVGADASDWNVEITPDGELFPVLDLSQIAPKAASGPGGGNGLVIVRVRGDGAPRHLHLEVHAQGLRAPAIVDADIGHGKSIELRPRLDWDTAYVRALKAPRRQALRVTLARSGLAEQSRDVAVRVHPLDDALYYVREGGARIDLGWVFAAYVNPDDPIVGAIVAKAREIDSDFDSPADGADANVAKAFAIWTALTRHGLRYATDDPALSRGPAVYSQRVRLLADVWNEQRANCLDGSVLIASVFERIGIAAFIALVPGHAFVGYQADSRHVEWLETTLLGKGTVARSTEPATADAIEANFEAARAAGRARWRRTASRFDRRHAPDYALIDIGTARSYGIIPLGAHGAGGGRAGPAAPAGLPRRNSPQ